MLLKDFSFREDDELGMFMVQLAATVLLTCEQREPSSVTIPNKDDAEGYDPIAQIMSRYVHWASHGYTNALQYTVELLYAYAQELINTRPLGIERRRRMIADALSAYQAWKTALVASDGRGSMTPFGLKDWADLNEQLVAAVSV